MCKRRVQHVFNRQLIYSLHVSEEWRRKKNLLVEEPTPENQQEPELLIESTVRSPLTESIFPFGSSHC